MRTRFERLDDSDGVGNLEQLKGKPYQRNFIPHPSPHPSIRASRTARLTQTLSVKLWLLPRVNVRGLHMRRQYAPFGRAVSSNVVRETMCGVTRGVFPICSEMTFKTPVDI